ncbi:type II toxin-antitoxin system HicA family toxin [Nevskia sp.]|uniref:type II toxin-antitoxin system HicA family toxin n=1 Tax=Nevskia sp. TaxID=1929292 RepID=UPI0025EFC5C7|nr:type II toxin-antitoxin system HicA family toxin [Nevskia sp.]
MKTVSGKQFAKLLERRGWVLVRVNGSHHIYAKPGEIARISLPVHGSTPLKLGLQHHMMKLAGIAEQDL